MPKANVDIRQYAKEKNVRLWEIAQQYGCTDATFSRKLRIELPESNKRAIRSIIRRIASERQR